MKNVSTPRSRESVVGSRKIKEMNSDKTHSTSPVSPTCQNCKKPFTIEPADFGFYEHINVPPPTFCPDCRFGRRLLFWNAVNLYKRTCDLCKNFHISTYPPEAPYKVYCAKCWWSDKWDPRDYGREYDFSRPFFEQLDELWHEVPLLGMSQDLMTQETCPYSHDAGHLRNCYLIFHAESTEDSACGFFVGYSQNIFDSSAIEQSQSLYDCMHCYRANRCIGIRHQLSESIDCLFCRDCQNCQNCFASANLKNKKYYAWNKPLSKEEYFKEIAKYDLGSYRTYKDLQAKTEEFWKTQMPKSEYNEFVTNCTGPNIFHSKNVKDGIEVYQTEDSRYVFRMWGPNNNCYDISMFGINFSNSYEGVVVGGDADRLLFCREAGLNATDIRYSTLSTGGNHHFGCVSMKKGDHVILNRMYPKEEYEKMAAAIREQMDKMPYADARGCVYKYGEFFPPELSPFAYNTTLAQNFFPLSRTETAEKKYAWRDEEVEEHEPTLKAGDIPDHIKDAPDSIVNERIACLECGRPYRIIKMELDFHRQMNVPLPRECPQCRIDAKLTRWAGDNRRIPRVCAGCGKSMESKYLESEAPKVFCKKCYQAAII